MQLEEKTTIYFAAPLFTQGEWIWNKLITEGLISKGFKINLPQERAIPMLTGTEVYDPNELFIDNISKIKESDLIVAVFDQADPDSGTCWECGFAFNQNIPIIGIRTDLRRNGDDPSASTNLMLSKSCKVLIELPFEERDNVNWVINEITLAVEKFIKVKT